MLLAQSGGLSVVGAVRSPAQCPVNEFDEFRQGVPMPCTSCFKAVHASELCTDHGQDVNEDIYIKSGSSATDQTEVTSTTLSFGPQHPAAHRGALRFISSMQGDQVISSARAARQEQPQADCDGDPSVRAEISQTWAEPVE